MEPDYKVVPEKSDRDKCLILVGGTGDDIEKFEPLARALSEELSDYAICSTTLSQNSSDVSLMEQQSTELLSILNDFRMNESFSRIDLWCTSMGVYPTIKILLNPSFQKFFTKVIFFDPADYYLESDIVKTGGNLTWAGYQKYDPDRPTIASRLLDIQTTASIDVVRLALRNQNASDYYDKEYEDRGIDHDDGFPRLSKEMVKAFYSNIPQINKGEYYELDGVPHGFIRDGNISKNIQAIVTNTSKLLSD